MEISAAFPEASLSKARVAHNEWLVNGLTFLALLVLTTLVIVWRKESDADTCVFLGVSGSAYIAMQAWSLLKCVRALREGSRLRSSYFALLVSLLLLNCFLLLIEYSSASTAVFVNAGLTVSCLDILVPVSSAALLLSLPLTYWLAPRIKRIKRPDRLLHVGLFAIFTAMFLPIPLFIHVAQFGGAERETSPFLNQMWKSAIAVTPEFVANAALGCTRDSRLRNSLLRTGRPSVEILLQGIDRSSSQADALDGLRKKDNAHAVDVALLTARTFRSPSSQRIHEVVGAILAKNLNDSEQEALLKEAGISSSFRDEILIARHRKLNKTHMLYTSYVKDSLPEHDAEAQILERIMRTPDLSLGEPTIETFAYLNKPDVVHAVWKSWIHETDKSRAIEHARLLPAAADEIQLQMILECLNEGSDPMQMAVLQRIWTTPSAIFYSERIPILKAIARNMQQRHSAAIDEQDAIAALSGIKRPKYTILTTRPPTEQEFQSYIDQVQAYLDANKSASQPARGE